MRTPTPPRSLRFSDHFSGHASEYARYRPRYPESLFDFLAAAAPRRAVAWDCATGSGQAAVPLSSRFGRVVATDASPRQIEEAPRVPRILYAVAAAEAAPLRDASVDLVTIAQALHWFDLDRFWIEVERVLASGGVVAAWSYDLVKVSPEIDATLLHFYREVVGPFWPPERALVERGYAALPSPFDEVAAPSFRMRSDWTLDELLGYVRTWSATRRFESARRQDPVSGLRQELATSWGDAGRARTVAWEVDLRVGRRRGTG